VPKMLVLPIKTNQNSCSSVTTFLCVPKMSSIVEKKIHSKIFQKIFLACIHDIFWNCFSKFSESLTFFEESLKEKKKIHTPIL